ncbi:hypothetical protein MC7420_7173 [Coleofasciculus chthonoplastes PCC 7420]|uniref:Uncharacterized protein n=1 Tax=Coleofasciculus chthonoplastes PCC 7420 TaxID=118168 RepID=B4VHZ7_9CYAN|nr:hypothetical protein [Coleofasciculus chthonoplastes]EDX78520.1 hypothetical protein MC7420_7173 [Coleofasciculus chthonoplastes PCC 7420]
MKKSPATEAHRVATDIAAIKSALQQQGYTTRKRPKQAAWKLFRSISAELAENPRSAIC